MQGCAEALRDLLRKLRFSADRDRLYFTGDLVNRGPQSAEALRLVRDLGDNAVTVLGNHDLHLLAHHFDPGRPLRPGDTLQEVLQARDRERLVGWLLERPLLVHEPGNGDALLHAGLVPQWSVAEALRLAGETTTALREDPRRFLESMYGNQPDRWDEELSRKERWRFTINVLTRLRYCRADGTIDLKIKDAPSRVAPPWRPWFEHEKRRSTGTRLIFGHWSTLGLLQRQDLLGLDTGCVWGGFLTAVNLDDPEAPPVQRRCEACASGGE